MEWLVQYVTLALCCYEQMDLLALPSVVNHIDYFRLLCLYADIIFATDFIFYRGRHKTNDRGKEVIGNKIKRICLIDSVDLLCNHNLQWWYLGSILVYSLCLKLMIELTLTGVSYWLL